MATVKELKAQAKAKGIKGFSTMKKAELEKALGGGGKAKAPSKAKAAEPAKGKPKDLSGLIKLEPKNFTAASKLTFEIAQNLRKNGISKNAMNLANAVLEEEAKRYSKRTSNPTLAGLSTVIKRQIRGYGAKGSPTVLVRRYEGSILGKAAQDKFKRKKLGRDVARDAAAKAARKKNPIKQMSKEEMDKKGIF